MEHAPVPHGDAVIASEGAELLGHATGGAHRSGHHPAEPGRKIVLDPAGFPDKVCAGRNGGKPMCWSEGASLAMVGFGAAATVVAARRGMSAAVPVTIGYFTLMEGLQVIGYLTIDDCSLTTNKTIALLSYVHIAFQPIFINLFAMAIIPLAVSQRTRRTVLGLAALAAAVTLLRLVPFNWAGQCYPGTTLCGEGLCVLTGTWHQAWTLPLNDMWGSIGGDFFRWTASFPAYIMAVFVMPAFYGAWRFALYHALCGPILAMSLTNDPNEMPAIWCLFSIALALVALVPRFRQLVLGSPRPSLAA